MREEGQLAEQLQRRGEKRGVAAVERVVEKELERGGEAGEIQRRCLLEIAGSDEKLLAVQQLREEEMKRADGDGTKAERVERILDGAVMTATADGSGAGSSSGSAGATTATTTTVDDGGCVVGEHR